MRPRWLFVALILCAGPAGCSTFWQDAARNMSEAPIRRGDQAKLHVHARRLARDAWKDVRDASPRQFSVDYADGFKAGFAEFVERGDPEPPAVPPFCYRLTKYASPEGHQAIEDWYAGYRHGVAAARASGERENVIIPLSAPPINAVNHSGVGVGRPPLPLAPPLTSRVPEELPPPRPDNGPPAPVLPEAANSQVVPQL